MSTSTLISTVAAALSVAGAAFAFSGKWIEATLAFACCTFILMIERTVKIIGSK